MRENTNKTMTYAQSQFPKMVFPTIHLNGNNGEKLGQQYYDALQAFHKFQEAFSKIEFHPRDYYVQGADEFNNAQLQRWDIFNNMNAITDYIEAHASHCFESCKK